MRIAVLFASAALICAASSAQAGNIAGTVYDSRGRPAADVQLTIADLGAVAVTAADGSYRFADVLPGEHRIAIGQGSQATQRVAVRVSDESDVTRNIMMISSAAMRDFQASTHQTDALDGQEAFAEALELADHMLRETPAQTAQDWRWRDLDG